jgi:EAL domain-containing protein (putative c-di-GMP-specific phosphodiesterase class I)
MLDDLLVRRQVHTVYQPLVHRTSGDIIGYEALARGPRGHALERPDLLFDAARAGQARRARLALSRARLRGALAAGLRPPAALFVNVEPEVVDAPPPREHALALRRAGEDLKVLYEVTERGCRHGRPSCSPRSSG